MTNVTPITDKQTAPSAKFTIQATIDGFLVSIEAEGRADSLRALIDRLKAIGAEPPQFDSNKALPSKTSAPLCPVHNSPMKPSRKPGKFYCARRANDGEYCRETA